MDYKLLKQLNHITGATLNGESSYYVYALFVKGDSYPFYIGKGTGSRVFMHEESARDFEDLIEQDEGSPAVSDKVLKILNSEEIVKVIVKFGLSSQEAFYVEDGLIRLLGYLSERDSEAYPALTNAVSGHATALEKATLSRDGLIKARSVDDFVSNYVVEEFSLADVRENVALIRFNKSYEVGMTVDQIYEGVRGVWRMGFRNAYRVKVVLAVKDGFCVGAFRVSSWIRACDWSSEVPYPVKEDVFEQEIVKCETVSEVRDRLPESYDKYFRELSLEDAQVELNAWRNRFFFTGEPITEGIFAEALGKRIVHIYKRDSRGNLIFDENGLPVEKSFGTTSPVLYNFRK